MNKTFTVLLLGVIFFASGCTNNISKAPSINSIPLVANLTITDKKGMEVYRGNHISAKEIKAYPAFLSKDRYLLKFEKDGYASKTISVEFKMDGWYFGNNLFGENIGLLIIDPMDGAMYKLEPQFFKENLILSTASVEKEELKLFGLNQIPSEWKRHLVSLD